MPKPALTEDEIRTIADALRVAVNVYEKDAVTDRIRTRELFGDACSPAHRSIEEQFRRQAREARALAERLEEEI